MATHDIAGQGGMNLEDNDRLSVINASKVADLKAEIGQETVDMLLKMLSDELKVRPAAIEKLIALGDLTSAAGEAHSLKGAAYSVGADRVANAARVMELSLGDALADADRLSDYIAVAARQTLDALETRLRDGY